MSDFIASLDIASFPVVVINKNGNVTGKNKEASDVFGDLRVGESIFNKAKPTESAKILFFDHHTFKRGYVVYADDDGDRRIVMFPMIIQNGEFDRELTSKMPASVLENELTVEFSSMIKDLDPSIVGKQDVSKLFPECAAELCITKMLGAPTFDCFIGDGVIRLYSRVPVLDADKALLNSPPVDFVMIADIVFGHFADHLT